MAKPITPTPKLDAKESKLFREKMERDSLVRVGPIPTPKLDNAIRMIMADARKEKE
jgi:hypothetical protein